MTANAKPLGWSAALQENACQDCGGKLKDAAGVFHSRMADKGYPIIAICKACAQRHAETAARCGQEHPTEQGLRCYLPPHRRGKHAYEEATE